MKLWQLTLGVLAALAVGLTACSSGTIVRTAPVVTETITITKTAVPSQPVTTAQLGISRGSLLLDINFARSAGPQNVRDELRHLGHADAIVQGLGESEVLLIFQKELSSGQEESVVRALEDSFGPLRVDMRDAIQPFPEDTRAGVERRGGTLIAYLAELAELPARDAERLLDADIAVMARRLAVFGIENAAVLKMGGDAILVEYARGDRAAPAATLGLADILEFGELAANADDPAIEWKNELGNWKPATGTLNGRTVALTSRFFEPNSYVNTNQFRDAVLNFNCTRDGRLLLGQITQRLLNKTLGMFSGDGALLGKDNQPIAPTVMAQITSRGAINGLSSEEAQKISKLLNAGSLGAPVSLLFEAKIEPISQ